MSGGTTQALGVPFYADKNPRLRLAQFAAAFFGVQPSVVAAVMGTNGKTSVAVFLRQVGAQLGVAATSMGMIGGGTKITANIFGVSRVFHIGSDGAHMANNALATLLAVAALSGDVACAANQLSEFSALKGCGAVFAVGLGDSSYTVIDESYNANPASMAATIALLSGYFLTPRRIVALGDMLELGPEEPALHAALAKNLEDTRRRSRVFVPAVDESVGGRTARKPARDLCLVIRGTCAACARCAPEKGCDPCQRFLRQPHERSCQCFGRPGLQRWLSEDGQAIRESLRRAERALHARTRRRHVGLGGHRCAL